MPIPGNTKGEVDWFGFSCIATDNFCFYLQNRLIQTSQTGGEQYSDTSPFSIPCQFYLILFPERPHRRSGCEQRVSREAAWETVSLLLQEDFIY